MKIFFMLFFSLLSFHAFSKTEFLNTREIHRLNKPDFIRWVSIKDVEESLQGEPPMNVGIDVDDTLIFSSSAFYRLSADNPGVKWEEIPHLWDKFNCAYIRFSIPKEVGKSIIEMHKNRGDNIYFITSRIRSSLMDKGVYCLDNYIQEVFNIKKMNPVIYVGYDSKKNRKTPSLVGNHIKIYYGDDDQDIEAAMAAGIVGVRVMRSPNSYEILGNRIGYYNEPVLNNSQY